MTPGFIFHKYLQFWTRFQKANRDHGFSFSHNDVEYAADKCEMTAKLYLIISSYHVNNGVVIDKYTQ